MPRDKTLSHERVMKAAREEFLEKGFLNASMRNIGRRAGMTSAGLYRHYKDKEDMFESLVKPAVDELVSWYNYHKTSQYEKINRNAGEDEIFNDNQIKIITKMFTEFKQEFKLLICCAQGTKYENLVNNIVKAQENDMMQALSYMREKGIKIKEVTKEEMHMLLSAYTTAILEPIAHDFSKEKTEHCLKTVEEFFMPGWKKIMGF